MHATALDTQVGGNHYKLLIPEPIDVMFELGYGEPFCVGSVIKYLGRHRLKNGLEDLKKAQHFLEILCEKAKVNWFKRLLGKFRKPTFIAKWVLINALPPRLGEALTYVCKKQYKQAHTTVVWYIQYLQQMRQSGSTDVVVMPKCYYASVTPVNSCSNCVLQNKCDKKYTQ